MLKTREAISAAGNRMGTIWKSTTLTGDQMRERINNLTLQMVNRARIAQGLPVMARTGSEGGP